MVDIAFKIALAIGIIVINLLILKFKFNGNIFYALIIIMEKLLLSLEIFKV